MSSADKKVDVSARRTLPPVRSHGGAVSMVVPAGSPRSNPPPPPLAALRTRNISEAEQPLAFVPQWENIPDPMRPAPKRLGAFIFKLASGTLAAGAFVAAGYFGALWHSAEHTPRLSPLVAAESARVTAPKVQATMLTSTAPAALRDTPLDAPLATPAPSTLASADSAKAEPRADTKIKTKRAASAKPSRSGATKIARAKRVKVAELPAPAVQAEASSEQSESTAEIAAPSKLAGATKKVPAAPLPEQPTRNDVQAGIEGVRSALNVCAAGAHGTVFANLTIQGNGRVSYSVVEGEFTNGTVGSCMARALRSASFPQFSGPSLKVRYPFVF